MEKGKFIVLEGLDGSGTTTQLNLISEYLRKNNIKVWETFEPTSGETGKLLRKYLSKEISTDYVTPEVYMYLYAADRAEHCNNIREHLNKGEWVICDRYIYSSYAYQGKDFEDDILYNINETFLKPDFVIYVNTPIEECLARIDARGSKRELYEEKEILIDVFNGYMKCFDKTYDNIIMVDGMKKPNEICNEIINLLGVK